MTPARAFVLAFVCAGFGCGGDAPPAPPAAPSLLPADYQQRFVEVRDCRRSAEHPIAMLIKTDPTHAGIYRDGPFPFPVGALVVKEEFAEPGCPVRIGYTLMRKEAAGYDPAYGDWHWQRLDAAGRVIEDGKGSAGLGRCASCHARTCRARDFTCAEP